MQWLKQSTAATVKIGPFVDSSDGATAETGLTLTQADVRVSKNGGAFAAKNESSSCSHDENGYYDCDLDTTDTGTLGRLMLAVNESGALPVWREFMILPANVYDSLVSGSDYLQAHAVEMDAGLITSSQIAANAITQGKIATDAITSDKLAASAINEIVDQVWDELQSQHVAAGSFGEIATEIASILSDTGTDGVVVASNGISSSQLAASALTAIADAILERDTTNVEDSASNHSLAEMIMAALNSSISGTTLTIKKPSDDSTFNTRTVTVDSAADPITGIT